MYRKRFLVVGVVALVGLLSLGLTCNQKMQILGLNLTGLMPLEGGLHYEGWAIIDGAPVSTGKFNLDANGAIIDMQGAVVANGEFDTGMDLANATDVVISIEPQGDVDETPSMTKLMAGAVAGDMAALSVAAGAALGDDFTAATGKYIFATPTNGANTDELSGLWFLDLGTGSPTVGLDLPTLPTGWKYEGWAVISGTPVTSGTFTMVDVVDDDDPYSGTEPGPPFPGEDYLFNAPTGVTFPTDLSGGTMVVSIEPDPDDSPAPFALKPLVGTAPNPAQDHVTYDLDNMAADFPTGTAEIK